VSVPQAKQASINECHKVAGGAGGPFGRATGFLELPLRHLRHDRGRRTSYERGVNAMSRRCGIAEHCVIDISRR
jgi:hypothetical protein